ncbi:MAG: hypothetical protein ACRDBX_01945 [Erysipelotrichaceae bacterium]
MMYKTMGTALLRYAILVVGYYLLSTLSPFTTFSMDYLLGLLTGMVLFDGGSYVMRARKQTRQ